VCTKRTACILFLSLIPQVCPLRFLLALRTGPIGAVVNKLEELLLHHPWQRGAGLPISADPPAVPSRSVSGSSSGLYRGLYRDLHRGCHRSPIGAVYRAVYRGLYRVYIGPMSVGKCKQPRHQNYTATATGNTTTTLTRKSRELEAAGGAWPRATWLVAKASGQSNFHSQHI
jgi:hypothetical protein